MKNIFEQKGEIDADLYNLNKRIYILFSGVNAKKIFFLLLQYKVKVVGFIVNKKQEGDRLYSLPFFLLEQSGEDSIYITDSSGYDLFCKNINKAKVYLVEESQLEKSEFTFIENGRNRKCNAALMITMILSRAQKRQAVFLINSEYYNFWNNLINTLENELYAPLIISVDTESEKVYELAYLDFDKLMVFIAVFESGWITEILQQIGLKQTQHFIYINNSFSGHVTDRYYGFDWFLGNTFKQDQEYPGFYIHGDKKGACKKIVILGNSASDPLFYPQKSWPEMLWEDFKNCNLNVIIYNGAVTDYNSTNEVIKMMRDVFLLEPDIVISYSGIIDFREYVPGYPYINLNLMRTSIRWGNENSKEVVYGIEDRRSAYERWLNNEKIMNLLCQVKNVLFYGILQPWVGSERINSWEKLQMWSDYYWQVEFPQFDKYISNAKEFKERIQMDVKRNKWLHDFSDIFLEIDDSDIYFDSIHVNELGNQIVAKKVGELLGLFEN